MREIVRIGLALATAATMNLSHGEARPAFANPGATELTRVTPVFEPHTEIDPRDAEAFRALMGDILNPVVNPQVFSSDLTSPRFRVRPTQELAPGVVFQTGYSLSTKPDGVKPSDPIYALVTETSTVSNQSFSFSFDPEGQVAVADPRTQHNPQDLIAGVNKALKNAPENWVTTDKGDYTESTGSTEINGVSTQYLLFGDGFLIVSREVPKN